MGTSLDDVIVAAVPEVASAAVAVIAVDGVPVASAAAGELVRFADAAGTLAPDRPAAGPDTVFDLASLTKLFTTVVVLSLAEEGRLGLDDPVATWLPGHYGDRPAITVRHLLTHTAGLPSGRRVEAEPPGQARWDLILSTPATAPPGAAHVYSDVGMITLGRVAEIAAGASLDTLVRDRITAPLGLDDTAYRPDPALLPRIAATEYKAERGGCVRGQVHDETAHALGGVSGHAGLFSTARDLLRFAEILRTGGAGILTPASTAEMLRDHQVSGAVFRQGLGVRIGDPAIVGPLSDAYGHSGFTGTSLVVDLTHGLTIILLTNNVHPLRDRAGIRDLRTAVAATALRLRREGGLG
ncbi:serine hydrolase domain-containing protein [Acrocarpospora catenulata]|uniref:serine hydrolase domain-containing protein n=1 Tax=Acrocarpospora catenulata TaxID=2836182 RepID=UPI001BDAE90F|nr:serine hydrolase domain-containing protein [Acrocarpospora catenulata]